MVDAFVSVHTCLVVRRTLPPPQSSWDCNKCPRDALQLSTAPLPCNMYINLPSLFFVLLCHNEPSVSIQGFLLKESTCLQYQPVPVHTITLREGSHTTTGHFYHKISSLGSHLGFFISDPDFETSQFFSEQTDSCRTNSCFKSQNKKYLSSLHQKADTPETEAIDALKQAEESVGNKLYCDVDRLML